jgi:ketosteroid isomerase-like protein
MPEHTASPGQPAVLDTDPCATVERFIQALRARDLQATLDTYAPDAVWEVHVPGGDGLQQGPDEIGQVLVPFYISRDGFEVARHRMIEHGETVALQCELHWRDEQDGAPCVSHQSHFFEVRDDRIQRHWLYCSGVRVYETPAAQESGDGGQVPAAQETGDGGQAPAAQESGDGGQGSV